MSKFFLFLLLALLNTLSGEATKPCRFKLASVKKFINTQSTSFKIEEMYLIYYKKDNKTFTAALKYTGQNNEELFFRHLDTKNNAEITNIRIPKTDVISAKFLSLKDRRDANTSRFKFITYNKKIVRAHERSTQEKPLFQLGEDKLVVDKKINARISAPEDKLRELLEESKRFRETMRAQGLALTDPIRILISNAVGNHSASTLRFFDSDSSTGHYRLMTLNVAESLSELPLSALLHEQAHLHIDAVFFQDSPIRKSTTINEALADLFALDHLNQENMSPNWKSSGYAIRSLENRTSYKKPLFGGEEGVFSLHNKRGDFNAHEGGLLLSSLMWRMRSLNPQGFRKNLSGYIAIMNDAENARMLRQYEIEWSKISLDKSNNAEYLRLHYALAAMKQQFQNVEHSKKAQAKINGVIKEFHLNEELITEMVKQLEHNSNSS